jgi:UDP-N-acetylglucosamine--N-acetylmuramyl-(pentapeptide) pyrophosphoryl-undecaprenol N-acetylglucosamine transferase
MPRVIISGGGTGGHIFPAIAIADELKVQSPDSDILFVGASGKMEMEKVPKAGYKIVGLNIAGLQRRWTYKNLLLPFKLVGSLAKAVFVVKRFRPDVVVGVGGYASGPVLKIANVLGIPVVIQEQNSYPGITNRVLAPKAAKICVAYDDMEKFFPKSKIVFTGNPVRKNILDNKKEKYTAKQALGLDQNKKTILVFGGSLGAGTINKAVLANADAWLAMEDVTLIWQVGTYYYDRYKNGPLSGKKDIKIVSFIEDMDLAYSAADVVVCRAGALTISELAVLGKAAILVPSPNVAEDHQTKNTMALVKKKAAILVKDSEVEKVIANEVRALLNDEITRHSLQNNIRYFARPEAASQIVAEILSSCTKSVL